MNSKRDEIRDGLALGDALIRMSKAACCSLSNVPTGDRSKCPICNRVSQPVDRAGGYQGLDEGRFCPRCGYKYE
jgi:hypothetical protein